MRPAGRFVASKPEKNFSISVKWCGFLLLANNFRLVCDVFISDIYTRRHADVTSVTALEKKEEKENPPPGPTCRPLAGGCGRFRVHPAFSRVFPYAAILQNV